jgi:chromosome segregation ATPase
VSTDILQNAAVTLVLGCVAYVVKIGAEWLKKRASDRQAEAAARATIEAKKIDAETSREDHTLKSHRVALESLELALGRSEQREESLRAELRAEREAYRTATEELGREMRSMREQYERRIEELQAALVAKGFDDQLNKVTALDLGRQLVAKWRADHPQWEAERDALERQARELQTAYDACQHAYDALKARLGGEATGDRWPAEEG